MKRIVWIAATLLIMIFILGLGLHALNDIDKKNKEYREQKEGEAIASRIAIVPETTTVWDRLRTTETAVTGVVVVVPDDSGEEPENVEQDPDAPEDGEPIVPDAPDQAPEQTSTVVDFEIVDD